MALNPFYSGLSLYSGYSGTFFFWSMCSKPFQSPQIRSILRYIGSNRDKKDKTDIVTSIFQQQATGLVFSQILDSLPNPIRLPFQISASSLEFLSILFCTEEQLERLYTTFEKLLTYYYNDSPRKYNKDQRVDGVLQSMLDLSVDSFWLLVYLLDLTAFFNKPQDAKYIQNIPQNLILMLEQIQRIKAPVSLKILGQNVEVFTNAKQEALKVTQAVDTTQQFVQDTKDTVKKVEKVSKINFSKHLTNALNVLALSAKEIFWS
jgi:hypothetical protein